jgi:hypothetical protein
MSVDHQRAFRTQTVSIDPADIRNETFQGREYLVVPVVALVEGVIQGANSEKPELVRISTLKKAPHGWNGRAVVMNHPVVNGQYVSANSPEVLEEWQIGFIFNSRVDGKKLKQEAWIDILRVEELGGDAADAVARLQAGEAVEISTGLFTEVDAKKVGTFNVNGTLKAYQGEWTNVLPDHLAFLSADQIGACSIADGCGTRVNTSNTSPKANCSGGEDCSCGCGKGAQMTDTATGDSSVGGRVARALDSARALVLNALTGKEQDNGQGNENGGSPRLLEGGVPEGHEGPDGSDQGSEAPGQPEAGPSVETPAPTEPSETLEPTEAPEASEEQRALSAILTHSVAPELVFCDVEKQVRAALYGYLGPQGVRSYMILFTQDYVVYTRESYDYYYSSSYGGGGTYRLAYSIDGNGNVTFSGSPEEVNVITRIIPVQGEPSVNNGQQQKVEPMAEKPNTDSAAPQGSGAAPPVDPKVNSQDPPAPKVQSVDEFLATAPPEMRDSLREGMRLQAQRRESLITAVKANSANKFTDDQLTAFDTPTLENLATLAGASVSYEGVAPPGGLQVQSGAESDFVPAPDVFAAVKPANTTAA